MLRGGWNVLRQLGTMIESIHKAWIDAASYEELLRYWRFAPAGEAIFREESGRYYQEVMFRKKHEHADPVGVSKAIGWTP